MRFKQLDEAMAITVEERLNAVKGRVRRDMAGLGVEAGGAVAATVRDAVENQLDLLCTAGEPFTKQHLYL